MSSAEGSLLWSSRGKASGRSCRRLGRPVFYQWWKARTSLSHCVRLLANETDRPRFGSIVPPKKPRERPTTQCLAPQPETAEKTRVTCDSVLQEHTPEKLVIRPPSEWRSVLVRVTRGCAWNRCKFCGIYPALGEPRFSMRSVEEIKRDIDCIAVRLEGLSVQRVFLGDADPLCIPLDDSVAVLACLHGSFPSLRRVTSYARASTVRKIGPEGMQCLAKAGLGRIHMGLESGDLQILKFHFKGQTPRIVIDACAAAQQAGIEVSLYVLLGLGGAHRWQEHIHATAGIVNRIEPRFVRVRRMWLYGPHDGQTGIVCPLWKEIENGKFCPQTPEGTVHELRRLIELLHDVPTELVCDHENNYVRVSGVLGSDKSRMLEQIDRFLGLPEKERRKHYDLVGSRI
ncbi:MAG: radical SAM protein [Chitinivibrionales bacterium]|nr:radical SAM protein [Chitinivibrionales bacterium]MBD3396533.1 radical SAM protein [Chitinivibrionales bacterium]